MSLDGDFQNAHFLSTGTILNEIFDVLSSEFPNIFLIVAEAAVGSLDRR